MDWEVSSLSQDPLVVDINGMQFAETEQMLLLMEVLLAL